MKIQINNKQNVFFCSDPHYGHSNIVRGTSNWGGGGSCRDFDTLEEHDSTLVDNINKTVGVDDILFCLGDWAFGSYNNNENISNLRKFREQLKCKNLHLVYGNHDQEIKRNKDNSQSLFSSVGNYLEIVVTDNPMHQSEKPLKYSIVLSHYSFNVWDKCHAGSWMLFGHSHGSLEGVVGKSIDVGFDTHKEFRPYSFQELKEIMANKEVQSIYHHN
jgi:calcineurin-like phosphoesterase family protein